VSKKVARLSVARHRIKRRVLEALRSLERPEAVIVFPQASVAQMAYDEIVRELKTLLGTQTN
jgi:ribonuclease P protein component